MPDAVRRKAISSQHFLRTLQPILDHRLEKLAARGKDNLRHFTGEDSEYLEFAYALQTYLQSVEKLDDLIERQVAAGDKPVAVPFAKKVLEQLQRRGFSDGEALHYLALFYQMRRALTCRPRRAAAKRFFNHLLR